jgi:Fanconi-associated nuclease 1
LWGDNELPESATTMALNSQSASKHNQMITRFIKHPKSTNFDGANDRPAKRQKTGDSPKKPPPTPRKSAHRREVPDSDAEDDERDIKTEEKDEEEHKTDLESALPPIKVDDEAIEAYEAFKASQEDKAEVPEERLEKRTWVRGKSSLYVDAFNLALETVLEDESHLFDEAETDVFRIWRELNYEAQYLYVRLFLRKTSAWHRIKNLGYTAIFPISTLQSRYYNGRTTFPHLLQKSSHILANSKHLLGRRLERHSHSRTDRRRR